MGRPAIADGQLRRLPDGRYCVRFKRPWQDGSTAVLLTGIELVGRLAALIPPPRMHLVRYYGVFAPHSRLRKRVVPRQQPKACEHASASDPEGGVCSRQKRMTWAQLSRRVFEIDVAQVVHHHRHVLHAQAVQSVGALQPRRPRTHDDRIHGHHREPQLPSTGHLNRDRVSAQRLLLFDPCE